MLKELSFVSPQTILQHTDWEASQNHLDLSMPVGFV